MTESDLKSSFAEANTTFTKTMDQVVGDHLKYIDLLGNHVAPSTARLKVYESKTAVLKTLSDANSIRAKANKAALDEFNRTSST